MSTSPACVEFRHVTKRFGDLVANRDVSFTIQNQSIHGVVGENGAGKSTIMKVLYGLYQPDEGEILLRGESVRLKTPFEAIRRGIGMVHQHFMLVPTLPVWQNVILGSEPRWKISQKQICQTLQGVAERYGFRINLQSLVQELSVGEKQTVEILKVLYRNADILILDEPTAVLTPQEVDHLFERLRELNQSGKTIILITHKLREILSFTQQVTVMRAGEVVASLATAGLDRDSLAAQIVGRQLTALPARSVHAEGKTVLQVRNLSVTSPHDGRERLKSVSFEVKSGEILGIAGVSGNGQQELIEALSMVTRRYHGEISFFGNAGKSSTPYDLKQKGLSVVPADRNQEGIIEGFTVQENLILGHHKEERGLLGWISPSRMAVKLQPLLKQYDVRPPSLDAQVENLSGGNQQKVIIARETSRPIELLLACYPTRGVDIGAIEYIHQLFLQLREAGAGILLVSSELDEILALSDRILVLYNGQICGECLPSKVDEKRLGTLMTGGGL